MRMINLVLLMLLSTGPRVTTVVTAMSFEGLGEDTGLANGFINTEGRDADAGDMTLMQGM